VVIGPLNRPSTAADMSRARVDQLGEAEERHDTEWAHNEKCGQHDPEDVTKCIVSVVGSCELGTGENDNKLFREKGLSAVAGAATGLSARSAQMQSNTTSTVCGVTPRSPSLWISTVCSSWRRLRQ
jgi:hypothetical protein